MHASTTICVRAPACAVHLVEVLIDGFVLLLELLQSLLYFQGRKRRIFGVSRRGCCRRGEQRRRSIASKDALAGVAAFLEGLRRRWRAS